MTEMVDLSMLVALDVVVVIMILVIGALTVEFLKEMFQNFK